MSINLEQKLHSFTKLLLEYNQTHSITALKNEEEVLENIEDSVWVKSFLDEPKKVLDIGSGAGFPGLLLAMVYPSSQFVLSEPINKKNAFLLLVKTVLKLDNVTVFPHRVENLQQKDFDLITSRAVAKTSFLVNLAKPFIAKDGKMLFYKGENVANEASAIKHKVIEHKKRKYLMIEAQSLVASG